VLLDTQVADGEVNAVPVLTSREITDECMKLSAYWEVRRRKFEDWYRLLTLDDSDLYQEDMEVVISNDPKTFFKLAVRLLAANITHSIPTDILANADEVDVSPVINMLNDLWRKLDLKSRRRGHLPWMNEFVAFLLITGWYDVLAYADHTDGAVAVARNPGECFPQFGEEGLEKHAHIYTIDYQSAVLKCKRNNWTVPNFTPRSGRAGGVRVYDYWCEDELGVWNGVVIDTLLVKPMTIESPRFTSIPIICGPVNGLPDRDVLVEQYDWQGRVGEGILADIEEATINYNKHLSFVQQIVRDVAQPKWFEKSTGDTQILNPDTIYTRGAIFRMGITEDVGPVQPPSLPIEISLHTRELQGMIQRGSFPWTMYGSLIQSVTSYTMAQISETAKKILSDFVDAMKYVISEVDNIWIYQMATKGIVIDGIYGIPPDFPPILLAEADVAVEIPGDFIQRATLGRMLSPEIRFSQRTTMDMLWPEVKDVDREIAQGRADMAMNHPVAITINNISAWRYQAQRLLELGDVYGAQLYNTAADALESQLGMMAGAGGMPPTNGSRPTGPSQPQQAIPREQLAEEQLLV